MSMNNFFAMAEEMGFSALSDQLRRELATAPAGSKLSFCNPTMSPNKTENERGRKRRADRMRRKQRRKK